jgi:hypothetical protein
MHQRVESRCPAAPARSPAHCLRVVAFPYEGGYHSRKPLYCSASRRLGVEEFLGCFGSRVDLAVDEESSRVRPAGTDELPCHGMPVTRELCPLGPFGRVLFQPEVTVLVCKAAQAGGPESFLPGRHVRELRHSICRVEGRQACH